MFISSVDQTLLNQYQVKVEVDANDASGVIIFQDRRFKVNLVTRPSGKNDADWQTKKLEENQMKETASKVAVMLLKKELLQGGKQEQPLRLQIHAPGFTNLNNKSLIATHKDNDPQKDTNKDYTDLMHYLANINNQEIVDDVDDEEVVDVALNLQEDKPVAKKEESKKIKNEKLPKIKNEELPDNPPTIPTSEKHRRRKIQATKKNRNPFQKLVSTKVDKNKNTII